MHILIRTLLAVLLALSLVVVGAGAATAGPGFGKYQDVNRAIAAGYAPSTHCVPGMGYHYGNFDLVGDGEVNVAEPEVLVYANGPNGLELVAVEWLETSEFELFGEHAHPGPFPGSYALHAWMFLPNPDGLLTDFNPRVDDNCDIAY